MISTPDARSLRRRVAGAIVIMLLVIFTFGRSIGHEFLEGDDQEMVVHQPAVVRPTPQRLARLWTGPTLGLYTPLAYSLWSGVATIAHQPGQDPPLDPRVFHGLNVALHAMASVIVFLLLCGLLRAARGASRPADEIAALIGATIFAVHPLQVEAIGWVAGMNNLLAGVFVLAALVAHLRFVVTRRGRWATIAALLFLAALFSKPTAIVAPLMMLAIDLLLLRRPWRSALIEFAIAGAMAVPFVMAGRFAQPAATIFTPPLLQRFVVVGDTLGFYAEKFVVPWPITIDYGRAPQKVLASHGSWHVWLSLAVACLITLAGAWRWRRTGSLVGRAIVAGSAAAIAGVSIVSGIVPFAFQLCSTVANRYVYLSMLGPAIVGAFMVARFASSRGTMAYTLSILVAIAMAVCSYVDIGGWKSTESVWDVALYYSPHEALALNAIGNVERKNGDIRAAEAHYQEAIRYSPEDGVAYYNYGNLMLDRDPQAAMGLYRKSIEHHFDNARVRDNLAVALAKSGRLDESAEMSQSVLDQDSEDVNALIALANVRAMQGDGESALKLFREAAQLDPSSANAADGVRQLEALLK